MWLKIVLLLLISCVFLTSQDCPTLVPPFSQVNCTSQANDDVSYYYYLNEEESCVPSCKAYETSYDGVTCSPTATCPPGYSCEATCSRLSYVLPCTSDADCPNIRSTCTGQCIAGAGNCMSYHMSTVDFKDTYWSALNFKPTCDNDGNWEAKQCKGGISGRCMCYDSTGKRLFGQALYSEATDMTCACVRRKAELVASGRNYVSFHCDTNGNFEKLQCDSGQCWCVEPKTGDLTSAVVPEKAMSKLPCYVAADVGGQYLRQCESKKYAIAVLTKKLQTHGVKYVTSDFLLCDDDGSYGTYSISSGIAYCTWRDNSKIGTWQSDTSADYSTLNCYCARDFKKYSHNQECQSNGNYKSIQQVISSSGTYYYCVDDDGFPKSEYLSASPDNCTLYY